jgi:hypothetical protein
MHSNAAALGAAELRRHRYVNRHGAARAQLPQRRRAAVREHGSEAAGEHGGEPVPLGPKPGWAEGVDAAVDSMEPPRPDPLGNPVSPEPEFKQLSKADHPVLPPGERRQPRIHRG